jgi:hypothetical protein
MRCSRLYEALLALSTGNDPGAGVREDLVGLGLAAHAASPGPSGELDRLKGELLATRQEMDTLIAMRDDSMMTELSDEEIQKRLRQAVNREAALRQKIVSQVCSAGASDAPGATVALTYQGREALQVIGARMPAAGDLDWAELSRRVELLRARLASEAAESAIIFKEISRDQKPEGHHLLRSAAVGLASVNGEPLGKALLFTDIMKQLRATFVDDQHAAIGAEIAIAQAAEKRGTPSELAAEMGALAQRMFRDPALDRDEYRALPVLLMALPAGEREQAFAAAMQGRERLGSALGAALLRLGSPGLEESGERERFFLYWNDVLRRGLSPPPVDAVVAAALLATARGDREAVEGRFREAAEFMASLFEDRMYAPAAVIALWPGGIEESLDNIRLAASEILQRRLSLGGMENFSLGMKLLSNNAQFAALGAAAAPGWMAPPGALERPRASTVAVVAATAAAAATAGALLLATPLLARSSFTVFHSLTVQQAALRQASFHPVHSHYLYG